MSASQNIADVVIDSYRALLLDSIHDFTEDLFEFEHAVSNSAQQQFEESAWAAREVELAVRHVALAAVGCNVVRLNSVTAAAVAYQAFLQSIVRCLRAAPDNVDGRMCRALPEGKKVETLAARCEGLLDSI